MWVRINPARLPLLTQRTEEFSRKQCQLWMHASEAMSSGKTPCEGNEIQKGNCRSKLNLYPELKMLLRKLGRCGGVPAEEMLTFEGRWCVCAGTEVQLPLPTLWCPQAMGRNLSFLYERLAGVLNPGLFIGGVNKRTVFVWTLCITATSMLWSKCMCTPDRGRGGGSRLSCCLVSWGTGWGKMHVGKYFLCASLSSRGLLTSVPVGYGAVQRSWTQVSNCEYSSERPLKKRRGNWKQS